MAIAESTEASSEATTARSSPAETRARLLQAATEVFLEHGYPGTRVQDIARRAGVTTGAMYAHFENKAALLAEAIAVQGDLALNELVDALGSDEHGPAGVVVGVRALSGAPQPIDRLLLEALAIVARGDETEDLIRPAMERMRVVLRARATSARDAGVLDPSISVDALVTLLERILLGSIVAKAIDLPGSDPAESEHLVRTFLRGFLADPD